MTAATQGLVASFMELGIDHVLDAPWELEGWLSGANANEKIEALQQELGRLQQAAAEKESFILDLLPVLDDLERALSREQPGSFEQMYEGVAMTLHRLAQLIHRHGIEAVEDVGRPFDPHRHEAVSLGHDPTQPEDVILKVIQRGYCRGDKVFRPAKVIVNDPGHSPGGGRAR